MERLETSICVGIVVYNTPLIMLTEAIKSIYCSDIELSVCLLCNSPDYRYQLGVLGLQSEFPDLLVLSHRQNKGFGAAHNEIFSQITCEWYVCANPDILVSSDSIRHLVAFGERHSNAVLIAPRVLNSDGSTQKLLRKHLSLTNWTYRQLWRAFPEFFAPFEETANYGLTQATEFVSGCFFTIRANHFRKLDGFDESFFLYAEDADLSLRASRLGHNYFVSEAVVVHQWGKAWTRSFSAFWLQLKSIVKFFLKHGLYPEIRPKEQAFSEL